MVGVPVDNSAAKATFPGRRERTLSRLARLTGRTSLSYSPILEPLLRTVRINNPREDLDYLQRAYDTAELHHRGQKRKSGDPYITHPVAVATILAELGMSGTTLAAALLHDTVEDTDYTLEQLSKDFGPEVAMLVDGVTKLDKVTYGDAAQAETVRKMVVAMAKDIRVLMIKLADRLHNARTWRFVSAESSSRKARETLDIFAPLAHRLGMNTVKWELEDLSFAALYPRVYEEFVRMVSARTPEREELLSSIREMVADELRESRIKATITGRPKHYYSIYQKMVVREKEFDDINDLLGVRILVDTVKDCYAALGVVHSLWKPIPGRFKDYIAIPKFNMYMSLHTSVIGPGGKTVEIQIRTHEMHRNAEYGVAAHWKYKHQARSGAAPREGEMGWLRSLVDMQRETVDPGDFLDSLRHEISTNEVFVFTPRGEIMTLPAGATPVDFAYAVHTEVGHRTIGARVNGKLVPLNSELSHGDRVEVFTSKAEGAGPSQDWQHFVKSARARNKIRQWFTKERREESIEKGKEMLTRAMRKQSLPLTKVLTPENLAALAETFKYVDVAGLYAGIGDGHISTQSVVEKAMERLAEPAPPSVEEFTPARTHTPSGRVSDAGVIVRGVDDVWVKLARCCSPVPPDAITGYVTRGSGISVHRSDCPNVLALSDEPDRFVEVEWAPTRSSIYLVQIQVEALDRKSLLMDVTKVLSDNHVNILEASVHTSKDRLAISRFAFEMGDPKYLDHILNAVRRIDGVFDVYRTGGGQRR
ncbi:MULTISPECIES: bifunctional (p)ppGpp synthetase/guanosine-3',5'-bis(diphosphate) 3'-pyrophosphohydrolase [Arthrobacter]|uniref:Bifunctional (P)ppGpp synthetase/guanosine-3',5'-bis(Diphosphate) 3'-pyrophosphohydrolase n=2 Tax=Arthrobacter TaxID=1663 RepID=A0ABU9KGR1_9MICC|nr:bifunctional (p)ppGpp synthetase/guanosine-3',5'-bis(diphosphate) 3'-pyrophosphohydrolase [Arthrobacter sp. YJM1]MDP5226071.1 bifunctional (p)ppGpp synthetase/guanosine-3',5'-bis(diphosphate) 3'-pyrophosphohydrolase [Arthrobacter sp. YJM1]